VQLVWSGVWAAVAFYSSVNTICYLFWRKRVTSGTWQLIISMIVFSFPQ